MKPMHTLAQALQWQRTCLRNYIPLFITLTVVLGTGPRAYAQTCYAYVDGENSPAPLECVQKGGATGGACATDSDCGTCTFNSDCADDACVDGTCGVCTGGTCWERCRCDANSSTNSCQNDCTSIPSADTQTILRMHEFWHQCFGSVGGTVPTEGRGQRWYAFHRQFEIDFNHWRDDNPGFGLDHLESIEWCPDIAMPHGHLGAAPGGVGHVAGCGNGGPRPFSDPGPDMEFGTGDDGLVVECINCQAFPACLFYAGAGPIGCSAGSDSRCPNTCSGTGEACKTTSDCPAGETCTGPKVTVLEDFPNTDVVSHVLDEYFHGVMHGAIGTADGQKHCYLGSDAGEACTVNSNCNGGTCEFLIGDVLNPSCSPRDPMFWRLHKALDDVVRAWQDSQPVDVVVVLDRSGSMGELDSSGTKTRLEAAREAAEYFGAIMDDSHHLGGDNNRIGIVSYDSNANVHLNLMEITSTSDLLNPAGNFMMALDDVETIGPGGCTSIGEGIKAALEKLCPATSVGGGTTTAGDCAEYFNEGANDVVTNDNDRKAILLLSDGYENRPDCLASIDPSPGGVCGGECRGDQFDFNDLAFTQLVAVGFGNPSSINSELLTLVAERQGGVYMNNPDSSPENDLKHFFVKALGLLTDEYSFVDPQGFLAGTEPVSEPVVYSSCSDTKLTFASGWREKIVPGNLRLIVTTPSGAMLQPSDPLVQFSREETWDYNRVSLPHRGDSEGTWRAHLIRPHHQYVNGFTPDSFLNTPQGTALVRRQIHRLCPDGCEKVLYFEKGRRGSDSAYDRAVLIERELGLLGDVTIETDPLRFNSLLATAGWDLIVYARMGADSPEPYDGTLASLLCQRQRAIVTDTRLSANSNILECMGVQRNAIINWEKLEGDGRLLDDSIPLINPGHAVFSYGITPVFGDVGVQATATAVATGAITARTTAGADHYWFVEVLGRGLCKLDPHLTRSVWKTKDGLKASVRMLPSYIPAGGFDSVLARVEVERPLIGLGTLFKEKGLSDPVQIGGEVLDARAATLNKFVVPTAKSTFELFDDGTNGDNIAHNAFWTRLLPAGIGAVDGTYRFRFLFDFTKNGCTTHREMTQTLFVDMVADPTTSISTVLTSTILPDKRRLTPIHIDPFDINRNCWGPGRPPRPTCGPPGACQLDLIRPVDDNGDGTYTIRVVTPQDVASTRMTTFGGSFDLILECPNCPPLESLRLESEEVVEHTTALGTISLGGGAPKGGVGGAVVYLTSSDESVASVPPFVVVPEGLRGVDFPIDVLHLNGAPQAQTNIIAFYGRVTTLVTLTVVPDQPCPSTLPPDAVAPPKSRYASFTARNTGQTTALRVTLAQSRPFPNAEGSRWWVQLPTTISEASGKVDPAGAPGFPTFLGARLGCDPVCADWGSMGKIHLFDQNIVSDSVYDIEAVDCSCDLGAEQSFSSPLPIPLARFADVCGPGPDGACSTPPNAIVSIINDVVGILDKFGNRPGAKSKTRTDINPEQPDSTISILDVTRALDGFSGSGYPFGAPVGCVATGRRP